MFDGCQRLARSLSHDMHCIKINPSVTKTSSLINGAISEKLIFLCSERHMPQNQVFKHFHQYEYDLSPINYFCKPKYHLSY